jgi:hypothetical protein
MASRRQLKKTIKFVSSELITDIYFRLLISKIKEEVVDQIVVKIVDLNREFVLRANRPDGKENPKIVKQYYRKLYTDWQEKLNLILKEIEAI